MKTRVYGGSRLPRLLAQTTCLAMSVLVSVGLSFGQDENGNPGEPDRPDILPLCPTAHAENVTEEGQLNQEIRVFFQWGLSVDRETLGDGDITVRGPDYEQRGLLVSVEEIGPVHFPYELEGNGLPPGDDFWFPGPIVVATYQVFPSEIHDGPWSPDQNGPYSIHLNENEVGQGEGIFYPPKLLGGFRVALSDGEPVPVLPVDVRISIHNFSLEPHPGLPDIGPSGNGLVAPAPGYFALVELVFDNPHVEVTDWGQVQREGNAFHVAFKAVQHPGPHPEPWPFPFPFPGDPLDPNGNIGPDGGVLPPDIPWIGFHVLSHVYPLGDLDPGEYSFAVSSQGQRLTIEEFRVPDDPPGDTRPPEAVAEVEPVTQPGPGSHELRVVYTDPSGVDISTLDDRDVLVRDVSRCFLPFDPNQAGVVGPDGVVIDPNCNTHPLRIVFVEAIASSNDLRRVVGVYKIVPPDSGWTPALNGFYTVSVVRGQVCDLVGNCTVTRPIGGFDVAIEPEPCLPPHWKAEIKVDANDANNVRAEVEVKLGRQFAIVDQGIRIDGNRVVLTAEALPTPGVPPGPNDDPNATRTEILNYDIGSLNPGQYVAVFRLNGCPLDIEEFRVHGDPPFPAEATIHVDPSDPNDVVARVHIEFFEHWGIVAQSLRRDGSNIYLQAQAEPLPIPAIFPPPDPEPVDLKYEIGALDPGVYRAFFRINGQIIARVEFVVREPEPIPAEATVMVDASDPTNVVAEVKVQFRDHYRIVDQSVRRVGNRIILDAVPEGPLPILAPLPPPPITLRYEIGSLEPGHYAAVFTMLEFLYAVDEFRIEDPGPPIKADVDLNVEVSASGAAVAHVIIRFAHPHVVEQGDVEIDGNRVTLPAKAEPIPTPAGGPNVVGPEPEPVRLRYEIGNLDPGAYVAIFEMNDFPYAAEDFRIEDPGPPILAEVDLSVNLDDPDNIVAVAKIWFAQPHIIVERDVVREGNEFKLLAQARPFLGPEDPNAAGGANNGGGLFANPVIVEYPLGGLDPGEYQATFVMNGFPYDDLQWRIREEPPFEADVSLAVEQSAAGNWIAFVKVDFDNPFIRIVNPGEAVREGHEICISAKAAAVVTADAPQRPFEFRYDLGELPRGEYVLTYKINRKPEARLEFKVEPDPPFEAEVRLSVDTSGLETILKAVIDFEDPYVVISDPGEPQLQGHWFTIDATAVRANFLVPPDGAPIELEYNLGELEPGGYGLVYKINGRPRESIGFVIHPDPLLPHVAFIEISEGNASHFATVGVVLDRPGLQVLDWGEVRRDGPNFIVDIIVGFLDGGIDPPLPEPGPGPIPLPPDFEVNGNGDPLVGGFPVRLVTHDYVLGVLDPGEYRFIVNSRGEFVAAEHFVVEGMGPEAILEVENIHEAKDEPHRFHVLYSDPDGLNHDSIRGAAVTVKGPGGFEAEARLVDYAQTEDIPSTGAHATYAVEAPGGDWDFHDNGIYKVGVDASAVLDLLGNPLANGALGRFRVRIAPPDPPDPPGPVVVDARMVQGGEWIAEVTIFDDGIRVTDWGEPMSHGNSFIVLATAEHVSADEFVPQQFPSHTYNLGSLGPGFYAFVFKTNLAHCGTTLIHVPGVAGDPFGEWLGRMRRGDVPGDGSDDGDSDGTNDFGEYAFALHPDRPDRPEIEPEVFADEEGRHYMGLRFRRLTFAEDVEYVIECSTDLREWHDASEMTEIVTREVNVDGTELVHVCLLEAIGDSPFPYLRVVARRLAQ